jgi:hypothetical protein
LDGESLAYVADIYKVEFLEYSDFSVVIFTGQREALIGEETD